MSRERANLFLKQFTVSSRTRRRRYCRVKREERRETPRRLSNNRLATWQAERKRGGEYYTFSFSDYLSREKVHAAVLGQLSTQIY